MKMNKHHDLEQALLYGNAHQLNYNDILNGITSITVNELNGLKFKYSSEFDALSQYKCHFMGDLNDTPANITKYFILIGRNVDYDDLIYFVSISERLNLAELGLIHWRSIRFLNSDQELLERLSLRIKACIASSFLLMFVCILSYRLKQPITEWFEPLTIGSNVKGNAKWKKLCRNYLLNNSSSATLQNQEGRPLKIAVLISGQFRGYKEVLPKVIDEIIKPLNADVYIHSWKQVGFRIPTSLEANRTFSGEFLQVWRDYLLQNDVEGLKNLFPNLFGYLENIDSLDTECVINLLNPKRAVFEDADCFLDWSGWKCMHYKMKSCFELANAHDKYDAYIRIRPDKELLNVDINKLKLTLEVMSKNSIMFKGEVNTGPFGIAICDQFAIGDYQGMTHYHNVYGNEKFISDNGLPGNVYQTHSTQAYNLFLNHVNWSTIDDFISLGDLHSVRPGKEELLSKLIEDNEENSYWGNRFVSAIKNDLANEVL